MNDKDRSRLVAFLKTLTDERVRFERAPFDHPGICVPVGHDEEPSAGFPASASDRWAGIPPSGRGGNRAPLQTFEELLRGDGADGSRAHSLLDACDVRR